VAVDPRRDPQPVREFGCWTADLEAMARWLKNCGVETVAMQSTGVFWVAVYDVLERHGFKVFLVNAYHTRNLPGRKSDVQECQWVLKLHTYGLLRNSFRPPEDIRKLRTIWRLRDRHVKEAGRYIQHMQKALTTMNVQLANVISDVSGVSGLKIVRAIVAGERDPRKLAGLRDWRVRASEEEIARSLEGNWQEDVLFELQQAVEGYDFCQKQIAQCDVQLQRYLGQLPEREVAPVEPSQTAAEQTEPAKRKKKKSGKNRNSPAFDVKAYLYRAFGVDLTRIDGVEVNTALTILSEIGPDFRDFESEEHFTSWLMLSPRRDLSGGKLIRHTREPGRNRVAQALRMGATTLLNSDSYLGARYRHLRGRLGPSKAIKAMARYVACLIYRLVTRGQEWLDRGAEEFERKRRERELLAIQRKASALGYQLVHA
jgi:transposase